MGIRGQFNESVAACQYTICKAVLSVKKIKNPRPDACDKIMKAYSGIVKTSYKHYQYIGDCACSDPECTHFQAFCVYTYWLGFKHIWNHPMC
uniref:SCP domain-containing protein n=1 Tax=Strongyloides papillosus TaxID=174720 RepID=A0A0N5BKA5_STREA